VIATFAHDENHGIRIVHIFRLICVIVILIEGWTYIWFVVSDNQPKPDPNYDIERSIPAKPAESPPIEII
jgi:hypothetical protein